MVQYLLSILGDFLDHDHCEEQESSITVLIDI